MDVIEKLIAGHREIREREDIVRKLAAAIDNDTFFWENAMSVSRFLDFEVRRHIEMEERVLFPVLIEAAPSRAGELAAALEGDHCAVLEKLGEFDAAAKQHLRYPSRSTRSVIAKAAGEIIDLLLSHTEKEDNDLFPLVREHFTAGRYRQLEDRYFRYLNV